MFSKINNTTSFIHNKLKTINISITLYNDGFGIEGIGSMRLSNVSGNIKSDISTAFKMLVFLSHFTHASEYFCSPSYKNNYRFDGVGINVTAGDCGTIADHAVSYPYEAASQLWAKSAPGVGAYSAQLFRGAGETINSTIENCLTNLIQQQVHALEGPIDAANAAAKAAADAAKAAKIAQEQTNDIILKAFLGSLFGCIGTTLGITILALVINKYCCTETNTQTLDDTNQENDVPPSHLNDHDIEKGYSSNDENTSHSDDDIETENLNNIANEQVHQANNFQLFKYPIAPRSNAERLEKIILNVSIPKKFICPITLEIMSDPCITNDGHSYEKSALTRLRNNEANCPIIPSLKVTSIIPNHLLRGEILSFIEEQEKISTEKQILPTQTESKKNSPS